MKELGNGYTKSGEVAGDYKAAGRDPELPRTTDREIEWAVNRILRQQPPVRIK